MSKPSIQNITVTQTFQNWFDKTNEMVDIFRDQVVTASVSGDTTTGNATLLGSFTANTLIASNILEADSVTSVTTGGTIQYSSPISITGTSDPVVATFNYASGGGRTRYTNGAISWDIGMEDSTNGRFIMNTGITSPEFALSTQGVLEVPSIITSSDVVIGANLDVTGVITGDISANNITVSGVLAGTLTGNLIGDVFAPNGTTKVLENGNGTTIPATFTGNVNGTVSSLTNHTTNSLTEGTNNLYFTTARARGALSAGTGVTYSATGTNAGQISIGQTVATTSNVTFKSIVVNGGTGTESTGTIVATGNITAFGTISDITMKENINPIENALEKISKLGGYTFNYKGDDTPMTGVMAQELMNVLPGVVYEVEDPKSGETVYAVRHGNIIGLLIEAIKELKEQIVK
jgi:hypothetical protein